MGNSFGKIFKLTSFGESHGKGIGGVIDGVPPNIPINVEDIQNDLQRRKPCLLYTSPSPRDLSTSRMPSSA